MRVQVIASVIGDFVLNIHLSKKQLSVLQDALDYSACQFEEGGSESKESIEFLRNLHANIAKLPGVKE